MRPVFAVPSVKLCVNPICKFVDSVMLLHRGFKALKQIVKLHYRMGNYDAMLTDYR